MDGDAAIGGSLTVGGDVHVTGNINAQVVYVPPPTWDVAGQPVYDSHGPLNLSASSVIVPTRMGIGTSNLSGNAALTISGDIVCRDLFTAASTVYIGGAKLSQSGDTLNIGGSVSTLQVGGIPVGSGGGGWVDTATSSLNMNGYTLSANNVNVAGILDVAGQTLLTGVHANTLDVTNLSAAALSIASNVTVVGQTTLANVSALALSVGGYTSLNSVSATTLSVNGSTTLSGGLTVLGSETVTASLTVNNRSILSSVSASTVDVTGLATLSGLTVNNRSILSSVSATALGVTGQTTLTSVSASALSVTGATNLSNVAASGTLGVTGQTTLTSVSASALSVTGATNLSNVTASGTLGVTGQTTLTSVSATALGVTGQTTLSSLRMGGTIDMSGFRITDSTGTLTLSANNIFLDTAGTDLAIGSRLTISEQIKIGDNVSGSNVVIAPWVTNYSINLGTSRSNYRFDTFAVNASGASLTAATSQIFTSSADVMFPRRVAIGSSDPTVINSAISFTVCGRSLLSSVSATTLDVTGQTNLASVSATSLTVTNPISFANLNVTSLGATRMASAIDMSGYRITDSTGILTLSANSIVIDSAGFDMTVGSANSLNLGTSNSSNTLQILSNEVRANQDINMNARRLVDNAGTLTLSANGITLDTTNLAFRPAGSSVYAAVASGNAFTLFAPVLPNGLKLALNTATGDGVFSTNNTNALVIQPGGICRFDQGIIGSNHASLNTVSAASVFITNTPVTQTYTASPFTSNLGVGSANMIGIPGLCNIDITAFSRYKTLRLEFLGGVVYGNGSSDAWNIVVAATSNVSGFQIPAVPSRIVAQKFTYLGGTNNFLYSLNGTSYGNTGQTFLNVGLTLPGTSTLFDYGTGVLCIATAGGNSFIGGTANNHQPPTIRVTGVA